ncbi:hypothetical protein [uncultured Desulfovibrio sp.]|uniref:hypothetical protein n=1 Tax=uncultured Desulfovibrio sp. TaxID=167968 RepID=UPI00261EB4F5|nr:hypothetical protein [uncultured Desulfovibrio sp.]
MRNDAVNTREIAQKALRDIRQAGAASENAVCVLMQAKLREAREELELATDSVAIFRAQGRAQLARDILDAFNRNPQ